MSCRCSFSRISFNDKCMVEWLLQRLGITGSLAILSASFSPAASFFFFFFITSPSFGTRSSLSPTLSVSHPHSLSHSVPLAASGCLTAVPLPMYQGAHWTDNTNLMYVRGCICAWRCSLGVRSLHVCVCVCLCERVCYMLQMPVLSLFMCSLTQTSSASFAVRATSHYSDCWGRERRAAETSHTHTRTRRCAQTYTHSFSLSLSISHAHSTHTVHTQTSWASGWEDVTVKSVTF